MDKYDHVRTAKNTRDHSCHWPSCPRQVKPALWGCYYHWMKLPSKLRADLWAAYTAGQEETGEVSKEYIIAANAIQEWIQNYLMR